MTTDERIYGFAETQSERILRAVEIGEYSGFCIACGIEVCSGIEPDACAYLCESCGERTVYGAQELLLYAYS